MLRPSRAPAAGATRLALLALPRLGCLAVLMLTLPGSPARAEGFDLDFWKPASSARTGYFSEESARVLPEQTLDLGVSFGYARRLLVIREQMTGGPSGAIVKDRFTGYLSATFGLWGRIDVGLRVPAVLRQTGDVEVDLTDNGGFLRRPRPAALGDVDLLPRIRVAGAAASRGFRMTLSAPFGLPTGARDALAGAGSVSFRPRLIAGWEAERVSASVSVGFEFRRAVEIPRSNLVVGNAAVAGAGLAYMAIPYRLWAVGEASVRAGVVQSPTGAGPLSAESLLGARALLTEDLTVQAGVGTGLTTGAGSPRFRALLTFGYLWGRL
ncbi:MAG: hypothetical protein ABUS79_08885 [Pseudomonadota bacterium]